MAAFVAGLRMVVDTKTDLTDAEIEEMILKPVSESCLRVVNILLYKTTLTANFLSVSMPVVGKYIAVCVSAKDIYF